MVRSVHIRLNACAQLKAEVAQITETLDETRTCLEREGAARTRLEEEVSALRLDRERDMRDLRTAHSAELTSAREDGVRRAEEAAAARDAEVLMNKERSVDGIRY